MSAIHDLIAQISDARLRERLAIEWVNASKEKKFGLVFEDHLPELLPLYDAKPVKGDLVCLRSGQLKDVWQVKSIHSGLATCIKPVNKSHPSEPTSCSAEERSFPVNELIVVREFGEPIFPSLVPIDAVSNGPIGSPWHTLIEADNYHALQLLDYLYAGKVDCIYIDPPYNTGARDWKYNNDYVDSNDGWRHSKWLAFMDKRLKLAKKLLKPKTGVMIVTIDQNEVHHLALLVDEIFSAYERTLVTIVIHGRGNAGTNFDRVEEFAIFISPNDTKTIQQRTLDSYNSANASDKLVEDTRTFVRTGNNSTPEKRPGMDYPIWVNVNTGQLRIGDVRQKSEPRIFTRICDEIPIWPFDERGTERVWRHNPEGAKKALSNGLLSAVFDEKNQRWRIRVTSMKPSSINHRTVWQDSTHAAKNHGTSLLTDILGSEKFSFPKSIYAVRDCLAAVTANNKNALIVDFFAGSGTTLNAVNLLNATDGGNRRCILVTNNEVSAEEANILDAKGIKPCDYEWESLGICRSVTWPRSKFTILGRRDDGTPLPGDYLTGVMAEHEKSRKFTHIGFVDPLALNTTEKKKQLVSMLDGITQNLVSDGCKFIVSEKHSSTIIFDVSAENEWLENLSGQDHISKFYILTPDKKKFSKLKSQVNEIMGPMFITEEITIPMNQGFAANLAYFKLTFLDKTRVSLRQSFKEILPLLWLKSGAYGGIPDFNKNSADKDIFSPDGCNFVVLLDETKVNKLIKKISGMNNLSHVFVVTDADESFKSIANDVLNVVNKEFRDIQVVQLYRDYLINFMINKNQEMASGHTVVQGNNV